MKDLKTVMKNPPILSIPDNLVLVYDHFIELWRCNSMASFTLIMVRFQRFLIDS